MIFSGQIIAASVKQLESLKFSRHAGPRIKSRAGFDPASRSHKLLKRHWIAHVLHYVSRFRGNDGNKFEVLIISTSSKNSGLFSKTVKPEKY